MSKSRHHRSKQPANFLGPDGRGLPQLSGQVLLFSSHRQRSREPSSTAAASGEGPPFEQQPTSSGDHGSKGGAWSPASAAASPQHQQPGELSASPAPDAHVCSPAVMQDNALQSTSVAGAPSGNLHTNAAAAAVAAAAIAAAAAAAIVTGCDLVEQVGPVVPRGPACIDWLACVMAELLFVQPALQALIGLGRVSTEEVQQLKAKAVQEALDAYCAEQPLACTTSHAEQQLHATLLAAKSWAAGGWGGQRLPAPARALPASLTQQDLASLFGDLPHGCQRGVVPQVQAAPTQAVMAACVELIREELAATLAPADCPNILPAGLLHTWEAQKKLPTAEKAQWLQQQCTAAGLGGATGLHSRWLTLERCPTSGHWMVLAADQQEGWVVQLVAHQEPQGLCRCAVDLPGQGSQAGCPGSSTQGLSTGGSGWSPQLCALSELVSAMLQAHSQKPWQPQLAAVLCPQQLPEGCDGQVTALWALTVLAALAGRQLPHVDIDALAQCGRVKWAASLALQPRLVAQGAAAAGAEGADAVT